MKYVAVLFIFLAFFAWPFSIKAQPLQKLPTKEVVVLHDPRLEGLAERVVSLYPRIKGDLEDFFGWKMEIRPTVVLIKDSSRFQKIARNPLILAFAVPGKNLVVMNCARVSPRPYHFVNTLKHELTHLLLHHHIPPERLPKWLDEGISQWVSEGFSELGSITQSTLNKRAISGSLIPLRDLDSSFPRDRDSLILAYEESKGFIGYIVGEFGKDQLIHLLNNLRKGEDIDSALSKTLSVSLERLELSWHDSLNEATGWVCQLSYHLYEILFAFMGLLTLLAFIRQVIRKRRSEMSEYE